MTELERFADLYGLPVDEVLELLKTQEGRQTLGISESAPIEFQIRLLASKNLGQ